MIRTAYKVIVAAMILTLAAACGSGASSGSSSSGKSSSGSSASTSTSSSTGSSSSSSTSASSAAAFYKGKTLTIIVPYGTGGGYDTFARMVAKYIQKPLGVSKVIVENDPGGGGLIGSNKLYNAKPDGLTIGATNGTGDMMDTIFSAKGVNFNVQKFNWLGRPDNEVHVVVLGPSGPGAPKGGYTSFDQLMALKKSGKKVYVLASGVGSSGYYELIMIMNSFGIPYKVIAAYKGSHDTLNALLRGDGSVVDYGYGSVRSLIESHKVTPVAQLSLTPWSVIPNVPTVVALAKKYNLSSTTISDLKGIVGIESMGHTFAAPPGVPANRMAFLQQAFKAAVTNPAFVAQANKEHRYPDYASGTVIEQQVQAGLAVAKDLKALGNATK